MSPEEYLQQNESARAEQKAKQASFLVSQPLTKSPDEYAQASTLAKSLNLPAAVVDVNYKSFAQKMLEKRNETILKASPVLSSWLTKGENYRIAADTVEEMSWWELLPKQIKEAGKAVPGGTVNAGGLALEGVGQLITPEDGSASIDLRTRIAQAKSKTPEEISALRQEIFKQGAVNPAYAQSILSDVLAGDMTPADAIEVLGPLAGLKEASVALQKGGQATQEYAAGILPADPGMEESFGRQVGGGLGSLLTILGVGLATGGVGATVFGAAGGAGEATSRARKAGEDEDTQTLAAVWGLIPGMTDAIPIERILSNPVVKSGLASVLRSIGKQAALEGGQEAVQEILQNSIARSLYAPDQNVFKGVADGFATGGFVGALVEAGRVAFNAALPGRMQKRQGAAAAAPETAGTIAEVSQAAQGSVLRQRSPETFREFVDTAMTGKPVENLYVNADAFVEYFQGIGLDPFALVDEIDGMSRADLDAALESGDLKIPTASYAAKLAGSEYDQFFQENARFDPDGMSLSEARDFEATKADLMEEAWEEAEAARQEAERLRPTDEKIYDEVVHRLRVAGQSTDVSTAVAVLPQMFYRTAAAREGISPEEYLARYPLPKFQGAIPEGMQARNVDALSRTLAEARARKSVEPQRGPSLLEFISEYGGIANDRGELRARNAEVIKRGKGKKTLRLKRSSLTDGMRSLLGSDSGKRFRVDDVAQAAIESGFLMNHPVAQEYRAAMEEGREVPDITQALWDEIDKELRDGPPTVETPESARSEYLDEIEDYLDSLGLDLNASDDAIRAAIEADQASEGRKYGQGPVENMIVQHNLSAANLLHADKMRGLAVPSIAISNVDHPLDGFGEITLLGGPDLVDPRKDSAAKVFDADVYSPRYPTVRYKIAAKEMNKVWKRLGGVSEELGHVLSGELDNGEVERKGLEAFRDSSAVQLQFLRDTGRGIELPQERARSSYLTQAPELAGLISEYDMYSEVLAKPEAVEAITKAIDLEIAQTKEAAPDIPVEELQRSYYDRDGDIRRTVIDNIKAEIKVSRNPGVDRYAARQAIREAVAPNADEFSAWVEQQFGPVFAGEQVVTETASGDWKYLPHTLDNVVKILKKKLRDGEGWNYGVASIRSNVANQFKSVSAIKAARGKLIPADAMQALKDETNDEFTALAGKFEAYMPGKTGFGFLDNFSEHLKEVASRGVRSLDQYYKGLPDDLKQEAAAFLDKLASMPTEYFEAKLQRAVDLSEFKAAVIPNTTSQAAKDVLKYARVPVYEYDPKNVGSRAAMIRAASGERKLLFQDASQGRQYPVASRDEWYGEANFEASGGKMVFMSPDEYLASVRPLGMDEETRENIDILKEHIQAGKTLDPLKVFDGGKEDGRHRAMAAKELGIKRVPVVVFGDQVSRFSGPTYSQDASQGPRGSIAFPTAGIGQGDTVIRLFETSNLSTVLHELGHYFLTAMQADAARGVTHSRDDMEVAKKWWRDNAGSVAKDAMRVMPDVQVTSDDVIAALDNGTSGDMMKDAAIDVGMQEQWARGFEAFLFEGKSPSIEMRGIFAKFSAWMVSVYKRIAGLNVTINDDIRGVFDRMLATDEEISSAQREAGSNPFQATAEELGLTPEQFSKLNKLRTQAEDQARTRLLSKMMEPEKRKREAWFKEERAKVREEIERDLKSRPVYRAIQEVRFGKDFDGAEVPGLKMSREVIEREYGAGYIPFLPGSTKDGKGHRNAVFTNDGGVHPDVLAGSYGFRSGAELLDAMTQAPPLDEAIEAETDKAMRDRHGDVMTDGSLEAEALDAVHNDKRGEWMAAELKAVIEVAGSGVGLTHKEARAAARGSMGRMTVRDATNANRFLAAERKAGEEYARLMKTLGREGVWLDNARRNMEKTARAAVRGAVSPDKVAGAIDAYNAQFETTQSTYDVAEQSRTSSKGNAYTIPAGQRTATNLGYNDLVARVVAAKRRQLMNHALYMEARLTSERVEKVTTKLAKLNRANAKQTKTRNLDQVMAARAIAARFGLARPDTTFDFDAWVTQLQLDDPGAAAAMGQAITTYANAPVPFKDLTVDQFGAVNDAIENILETGKRYRSLEIEGQTVERDAAITELTAVLEQRGLKPNAALKARLTDAQKNGRSAISMLAALRRMENWARDMDDGEQGPFTRYLVRPVMSAVDTYRGDKAERLKELLDIINPRKEELLGGSIEAPELGYTFQNKGELLHALLHTGNESNLEKLLLGRGWSDGLTDQTQAVTTKGKPRVDRQGNPIMTRGRVDTTKWDTFIARMISQGKITKEDYDTAQAVWDLMERMKRPAQTAHRKMFGYYFDEVEANVVSTPFGDYKGGYVPAIADTDASNDGQLRADQAAMEAQQTSFMFPTTGKGFTKARVQNYHTPLALNLMLLPAHMDKVLRFTHIEPTVRQAASLVTNRGMREALDAFDPSIAPNLITPWLQRTAQQAVESQPSTPAGRAFSALARGLRRRVGVHTMFANLVNTAQQVTGFASAAVLVKPANLKKALVSFSMGNASTMRAAASDKSAFMKDRIDMVGRETQRRIQDVIVEPTISGSIRDFVDKHGYFMQTATQGVVDVITWHAAYDQAIGKGLSERDAVFEADSVVRRTMGDFSPENVSMFETGSAFQRIFTMFASYFNGQANLVGGEMQTVMRTMGWAGAPRMFWIYTFGIAIPAIVGEMIVQAAKGELLDDDDDDGYLDEIAELFFGSQARYLTGMVPVAGHVTNAILSRFNDQVYDDRLSTSPVVSTVERVVGAPFSIGKAITGDGSASKAVADGLTALGMITGIPTGALAKPAGYLTGIAEGKSKPEGPVDILQGIVSGRDGSEK